MGTVVPCQVGFTKKLLLLTGHFPFRQKTAKYPTWRHDQFYADVRKKYGSRGVAQAKKIKEQTSALFAGGELSEEDQANFIKEMEALFLDAKEEAKKFTPKKYL